MNTVSLIGNLATNVQRKEVGENKLLATFLLAVDRASGEQADFIPVVAWEKQAELCDRFLTKGKRVGVVGRLRSRSWEDEGKRRSALDVVAHHVEFLSPPNGRTEADIPFEAAIA
jgi:single-strand DNA-binding protein